MWNESISLIPQVCSGSLSVISKSWLKPTLVVMPVAKSVVFSDYIRVALVVFSEYNRLASAVSYPLEMSVIEE